MTRTHGPIEKIRGKAAGIAYTGIGTNWRFSFGNVIIIAANHEVVATVALMLEERTAQQVFNPEVCKEVAVFQMSDVEAACKHCNGTGVGMNGPSSKCICQYGEKGGA